MGDHLLPNAGRLVDHQWYHWNKNLAKLIIKSPYQTCKLQTGKHTVNMFGTVKISKCRVG